jgi:hypothetical protein
MPADEGVLESGAYESHDAGPMPTPSSEYGPDAEAIMLAHGIPQELLVELARDGFATVHEEPLRAGKRTLRVIRLRITATGRRAFALLKGK